MEKPKRPYNSTRRQVQAHQTRQQIADAALALFIQRGYAGATIEAIAQEAGVAPETVYATFGSKWKILSHLRDLAVGGDEQPIPLLERPDPRAVLQETDQRKQLRMFAPGITSIVERVWPIFDIMRVAAKTEPEIDDLFQDMLKARWHNLHVLAQRIAANGPLRMDVEQAADTIWMLTSPDMFRLMTVDNGWTKEHYIEWLAESLIRLLLPDD
jgi:AcrR family transcriptional regulator